VTPEEAAFPRHRLANGLTVIGQPMTTVGSAAVGILVPAGSRHEDAPVPAGATHFLTSLAFQGTRHRDAHALTDAFEEIGARHDAGAEPEFSWYTATVVGRHLPAALEVLTDVARYPAFPADEVAKVRGRILQEIAVQEDEPARKALSLLRPACFGDHPLGRPLLGTPAAVREATVDDLAAYWTARYTAGAAIVAVAGRFDFEAICRAVEELCGDWLAGEPRLPLPPAQFHPGVQSVYRATSQQHIAMAMPGLPADHPDTYVASVLGLVFGGSMNSRLFTEVREKRGLAYSVSASHSAMEGTGSFRVYAGTTPERAHESVAVILAEARRLAEHGITPDELARAKTKLKSTVVMAGESTAARRRVLASSWWYRGHVRTLDEVRQQIDGVDQDRVLALARSLALGETVTLVSVGPRTDLVADA